MKWFAGNVVIVYGHRSCLAGWCADHGKLFDVTKAALGHAVGSLVRRAYARSDLLDQRRALMDAWARFLIPAEAVVVVPISVAA